MPTLGDCTTLNPRLPKKRLHSACFSPKAACICLPYWMSRMLWTCKSTSCIKAVSPSMMMLSCSGTYIGGRSALVLRSWSISFIRRIVVRGRNHRFLHIFFQVKQGLWWLQIEVVWYLYFKRYGVEIHLRVITHKTSARNIWGASVHHLLNTILRRQLLKKGFVK